MRRLATALTIVAALTLFAVAGYAFVSNYPPPAACETP